MKTPLEKFQSLLRELFQFDRADLDFGIYRIMNYRRKEIDHFITENLPRIVTEELQKESTTMESRAVKELEEAKKKVIANLGDSAIKEDGTLDDAFHQVPLGNKYLEALEKASGALELENLERSLYSHLYTFFRRYYQDGDFISKRRYSKEHKYAIPYNGEEVYLYWANRDQYYVKTSEHFNNYTFKERTARVNFIIQNANLEKDNIKGDKRFFVPLYEEITFDNEDVEATIPFEFRPLTDEEKTLYGNKNQQRKIINEALEKIPQRLKKAPQLWDALASERQKNKDGEPVSHLEYHLNTYTKRNTSDFFIHKDLRNFLLRELDFYLKNEVLNISDMEIKREDQTEGWFQLMRLIKKIGVSVIEFLSQIEDFQKMLWEKKKFITETNYLITVGNIPEEFYEEIAKNEEQWEEWKELNFIGEEQSEQLFSKGPKRIHERIAFIKSNPVLIIDTGYFESSIKDRLLGAFKKLDRITDGLLIKGENFQALNILADKFYKAIRCIYIDPPFNSKSSEILYKNNYKHSSWASLIENRMRLSVSLLDEKGVNVTAIDENEQETLGFIIDNIFPDINFEKTPVVVMHNPGGTQGDNFSYTHEYAYFSFPKPGQYIGLENREDNPDVRNFMNTAKGNTKNYLRQSGPECFYPVLVKDEKIIGFGNVCKESYHPKPNVIRKDGTIEVYPVDGKGEERKWVFTRKSVDNIQDELSVSYNNQRKVYEIVRTKKWFNYKTIWTHKKYSAKQHGTQLLNSILGAREEEESVFPKSLYTVRDCISAALNNENEHIVLDYYAGSGTTGHAVISLNREDEGTRKFILIEMDRYFYTLLLPRIKKVIYTPEWKDSKPKRAITKEEIKNSPRIIKYISLESYEDALNNIKLDNENNQQTIEEFDDYLLKYMLKWESRKSEALLNIEKMIRPFDYRLKNYEGGQEYENHVDLPETFNYLLGLNVERRLAEYDGDRRYLVYRGSLDGQRVAIIWRSIENWDEDNYRRDRDFIEKRGFIVNADEVYVNGDSLVPGATIIEPIFKNLMFSSAQDRGVR